MKLCYTPSSNKNDVAARHSFLGPKSKKQRGIRKSLVQKEEIIDKKLVDEFIFSLATFAYEYL